MNRSIRIPWRLGRVGALATLAAACSQQNPGVVLRSLESSGEVSFVCLGREGTPRDVAACPDVDPVDGEDRDLYALLTQPFRGEVAVVDLTRGRVVDAEPSIPGFGFLPVGADPVSVASTPGSTASFVGVAEVGREGIFALPSSCILAREEGAPLLGIDSWPACRLPSAPGELAVLVDPAVDDDGDPATPPLVRSRCDATDRVPVEALASPAGLRERCPADLSQGEEPPGRQKLLATLPDRGAVVVIDAQELLDREPGSFEPCPIERYLPLGVDLPAVPVPQSVPDELRVPGCGAPGGASAPPARYLARPAGVALLDDPRTGEHHAYVADLEAPVIHSLSTRDPCAIAEEPPLLPTSFADPDRIVTTRNLAVSPLTHDGRRFVYAVDPRGGGSVMVFDVTPGESDRTPLVRSRSRGQPFEPPDRIAFDAPAEDVAFVLRDSAVADPDTGVARSAVLCDPDPSLSPESPGALLRPSGDFSSGARPGELRGIFAFVALDSGQLATIDVDDWDAACRRPVAANPAAEEDSRGCAGDPDVDGFVDVEGNPTVTREESCQIVQAHRARAASVFLGEPSVGGRAPSLRTRPKVVSSSGRTLPTDGSEEGRRSPRLLGVAPSEGEPARLYVGTTLLEAEGETPTLVVDPRSADQLSVSLSFAEPRAHAAAEDYTLTYEGLVIGERRSARVAVTPGAIELEDGAVSLCAAGVEDEGLARARASGLGVADGDVDAFGRRHADFVTITSDLLPPDDAWWRGRGATCGGADPAQERAGYLQCRAQLGTRSAPVEWRELRVLDASRDRLVLAPRAAANEAEASYVRELIGCCFPQAVSYTVRASHEWVLRGSRSGVRHGIATGEGGRCERTCDASRVGLDSRAFEVACRSDEGCPRDATGARAIGLAAPGDVACLVDERSPGGLALDDLLVRGRSGCVFQGLTTSFTLYRAPAADGAGAAASVRDLQFSWSVVGGFSPFVIGLSTRFEGSVTPASLTPSPSGSLLVPDGASRGLLVVDTDTFSVSTIF